MKYLEWLEKTVRDRLAAGPVGKPVFVRADLQLAADHGLLGPLSAAAVESCVNWINAPVRSLYALGGAKAGFVSVMLEFGGGQTAVVNAELVHAGDAAAQLLVIGQSGTLRFDDFPELPQLEGSPATGRRWHELIQRSIESGKPSMAAAE